MAIEFSVNEAEMKQRYMEAEESRKPYDRAAAEVNASTEGVSYALMQLEEALMPVLQPDYQLSSQETTEDTPTKEYSPVARFLNEQAAINRTFQYRIERLLQRLEV